MTKEQEEAIKRIDELRDSYELHQKEWATKCLNIIEDYVKNSIYKDKTIEKTEENKSIKTLKNYIENDDFYNLYQKKDKQDEIGGTHINFCKAIETVLDLISKLQKEKTQEKESWQKYCNELNEEIIEKNNKIFDLEMQVEKLQKENKEKDKQIDLKAEYISNLDIDEDICKEQSDNNCDDINREVECKECIKQYFENKAKE